MYRSIIAAGTFTILCCVAQIAGAAKKPTVCLVYVETTLPVDGKPTKVAICEDGKKPVVLTSYVVTSIKDEDGESVKAVIGWR